MKHELSPRNPDDLIRRPNQSLAIGQPPSTTLRWEEGKLYKDDWNNFAPSIGVAWDPTGDGRQALRGNYRMAYDRINTFLLSSAIFQSIPGITTTVSNTTFGQAGGRLRQGLPSLQPVASPDSFLQPAPFGTGTMRVVDPEFQSPLTHGWAISYQRQLFSQTLFEIAYVGRRAEHLFGAYNVNQAEIFDNGFLDAFNTVKAGGESALMNQLRAPGYAAERRRERIGDGEARLLNRNCAELRRRGCRVDRPARSGGHLHSRAGGPRSALLLPLSAVHRGRERDRLRGLFPVPRAGAKVERRFSNGYSYLFGYTFSRSKDTRSFDPAFTVVGTANAQSASSTPFDINDRDLNYALSDFDRPHVFQAQAVWELPFGQGQRFGGSVSRVTDVLIGGWQLSGQFVGQSGRPMTVYGGSNTLSNVVQTPANCNGAPQSFGSVHEEDGLIWYFTPEERAKFSTPDPGEFSNVGRNYFRGPGGYFINLSLSKRTRIVGSQILEIRIDRANVTNHPVFGFPTLTTTSATFGRIRNTVNSSSRKIMLGAK